MGAFFEGVRKLCQSSALVLVLFALLACGVIATETRLLFFWPTAALLGAAAVFFLFGGRWRLRSAPADACLAVALLFGIYMIVRAVYSPVTVYAREDLYLLLGCMVVYTFSATALSDPRLRLLLLWLMIVLTLGNLAVGFVHFSGRWSFHIVPHYMRTFGEGLRIGGFFNNPNHLAAFLTMMAFMFAGTALFSRHGVVARLLLGFMSFMATIGVALTMSRGAVLGLSAGGITLAVLSFWMITKTYPYLVKPLLLGVTVLLLLAGLLFFSVFSEQLSARFSAGALKQEDPRAWTWYAALEAHETSPLIGTGSRMFYEDCITYRSPLNPSWFGEALFVHNDWLQLLTEYGWIGVALMALFIVVHFWHGGRFLIWFVQERFPSTSQLRSRNLGLVVGSLSALVAVMVHAIFDFHFHVAVVALTAALFFGILANPGMNSAWEKPRRIPGVRVLLRYGMVAAGVWLIFGAYRMGVADYYMEEGVRSSEQGNDMQLARIVWLTRAIERDPDNAQAYYQRGLARIHAAESNAPAMAMSFLRRAVPDLERARRLNPYSMYIALALADAYDAVGKNDEALATIIGAVKLAPYYEAPRLSLAIHYHRLQQWDVAESAYLWAREAKAGFSKDWGALYARLLEDAQQAD